MWEIIIALVLTYPAIETVEEWRRRGLANRLLAEMRKHVRERHRWDAVRGQWIA